MGLANLVPGISGGTILLAVGVYPQCIDAIARLARLRPDRPALALLVSVAGSAGLAILLLAGTVKGLVVDHRWAMFSLFLGSTLGGVPVLRKLIGKMSAKAWLGFATGLAAMTLMALFPAPPTNSGSAAGPILFLAGLGAMSAMLLPGLSGGYLLVLSGQYVAILGAVDGIKEALLQPSAARWQALLDAGQVLGPVALGAGIGLVAVSSLIQLLLQRQRALTLGFLLGLLLGAVLGLWPFQTASEPPQLAWPDPLQALAALGFALGGYLATWAISRMGAGRDET